MDWNRLHQTAIILLLLFSGFSKAQTKLISLSEIFLKSDLIVYGSVVSESNGVFKVKIGEVLAGKKYGLSPGNWISIRNDVVLSCGFVNGVKEEVGTGIFCLEKSKTGNGAPAWILMNPDFIPRFRDGKTRTHVNYCSLEWTASEWSKDLRAFQNLFSIGDDGKAQADQVLGLDQISKLPPMTHDFYLELFPQETRSLLPKLDCQWRSIGSVSGYSTATQEDTTVYQYFEQELMGHPPIPWDTLKLYIEKHLLGEHPVLMELGWKRTYFDIILEKDGSISKVIFKGHANKRVEVTIREYLRAMEKWKPAHDIVGNPIRWRFTYGIQSSD